MAARARSARAEILRLQASVTSVAECPVPGHRRHPRLLHRRAGSIWPPPATSGWPAPTRVFSVRETKVAIVADLGSLQRLPHIIGKGHVAELAYTGKDIDCGAGRVDRTGQPT